MILDLYLHNSWLTSSRTVPSLADILMMALNGRSKRISPSPVWRTRPIRPWNIQQPCCAAEWRTSQMSWLVNEWCQYVYHHSLPLSLLRWFRCRIQKPTQWLLATFLHLNIKCKTPFGNSDWFEAMKYEVVIWDSCQKVKVSQVNASNMLQYCQNLSVDDCNVSVLVIKKYFSPSVERMGIHAEQSNEGNNDSCSVPHSWVMSSV